MVTNCFTLIGFTNSTVPIVNSLLNPEDTWFETFFWSSSKNPNLIEEDTVGSSIESEKIEEFLSLINLATN